MLSRLTSYLSWTGQRAVRAVCCALLLTGLIAAAPIHAQEQKIKVAEVNGEAIFLEEVMKIAEHYLPTSDSSLCQIILTES